MIACVTNSGMTSWYIKFYLMYATLTNKEELLANMIFKISFLALILTFCSLFVDTETQVTRHDLMGCEESCLVAAAGFPKPFVLDGYVSPIGSISKDPLSILFLREDEFSLKNFLISYFFWTALIFTLHIILWKRIKFRENSTDS